MGTTAADAAWRTRTNGAPVLRGLLIRVAAPVGADLSTSAWRLAALVVTPALGVRLPLPGALHRIDAGVAAETATAATVGAENKRAGNGDAEARLRPPAEATAAEAGATANGTAAKDCVADGNPPVKVGRP